ncbi:hypothetical protein V6N11_081619 [Hibiscus sabdariffa]|uniref:EH domain-containing protein n=1 Tax=Hibiscus sabdariffa TaxID=183260 RepID=A0ABR2N8L0_9ROSI
MVMMPTWEKALKVIIFWDFFGRRIPASTVTSIVDGLKRLYIEKLKPLEATYQFNDFVSPALGYGCPSLSLTGLQF